MNSDHFGRRPRTPDELHRWIERELGVEAVRTPTSPGASAPFDYLCHAFFEDPAPADCVVWACRGGGKTFYAALATVLDLVFKPGIEVKVLAGSLEQAQRMHAHLRRFFEREELRSLLDGEITARRATLLNGSVVEVLAASERSVRGARPQKLRCDEVELFDPDVWSAAQLVTRSAWLGKGGERQLVRGTVEAFSTMHRPGGLMNRLVADAMEASEPPSARAARRIFRWGLLDVLEPCTHERSCEGCALWEECGGVAKRPEQPRGHIRIEDAIVLKSRVDLSVWKSEMLCDRPARSDAVYPEFDPSVHVVSAEPPEGAQGMTWVAGMDFGFRSPAAIVWGCVDDSGVLRILGEREARGTLVEEHARWLRGAGAADDAFPGGPPCAPAWVAIDPAGLQRSDQTGISPAQVLARAGHVVRTQRSSLEGGLALVRARLAPASGPARVFIHERCAALINALQSYHYKGGDGPLAWTPAKDGPDHLCDALRYLIVCLDRPMRGCVVRYA